MVYLTVKFNHDKTVSLFSSDSKIAQGRDKENEL